MKRKELGQVIKSGTCLYTEINIKANKETIWEVLTNFKEYPNWNPFLKSVIGDPKVDPEIEVKICPPGGQEMMFKPKVLQFIPNQEFRWIGKLGIKGIFDGEHCFQLRENQDGTTTFIQFECFRGILVPFLKKMISGKTKNGFEMMNEALKKQCEKVN